MTCSILPFARPKPRLSAIDAFHLRIVMERLRDADGCHRNAFWLDAGIAIERAKTAASKIENRQAWASARDEIARVEKACRVAEGMVVRRG